MLRMGESSFTCWQESGSEASRFFCGPTVEDSCVTISSRMASMGGFVTWAKQLLEIIVQKARPVREDGERRVVAHRTRGIVFQVHHGADEKPQIFLRVSKDFLSFEDGLVVGFGKFRSVRQPVQVQEVRLQPLLVWMLRRIARLDFLIVDDAAFFGVHEEDSSPGGGVL